MAEELSEFELIRAFNAGNHAAFNILAERYQQRIYWHARRMTGNHFDADDVLQEVLIVLYNKLSGFKFNSSLYTWIYRITTTRCINFINRKKLRQFFSIDDDGFQELPSDASTESGLEIQENMEKLDKVLQTLPAKQRQAFILRNMEQLSYDEISEITGTSTGALKANYFHAFEKVSRLMKEGNE